jgi:hypothetical protein
MQNILLKGATNQNTTVALRDSTTGQLKNGIVFGGVTAKYQRDGVATATTITMVAGTLGTYTSGGFIETQIAGNYQLGIPAAAIASGAEGVNITVSATGCIDRVIRIVLIGADLRNATSLGLADLDAAISSRGTSTYAGADTAGTTTLLTRITGLLPVAADYSATRAAKLDNLDVAISVLQTAINNLNNLSALANLFAPSVMVRPGSGSIAYPITFVVKDVEGHLIDVDTNTVTLTAANAAGTDRSANLSAVTHTGTGEYTFTYTVATAAANEGLKITASGTVASATRKAFASVDISDADSLATLVAIKAQTDLIATNAADSPNAVSAQGNAYSALQQASNAATQAGAANGNTATLVARIPGTIQPQTGDSFGRLGVNGAGLTAIGDARVAHLDVDVSTRATALQVDTQLSGVHGVGAWGGSGGGGGSGPVVVSPVLATVNNPLYAVKNLPSIPVGSAPATAFTVTDSTGAPVNLAGKTIRFVAYIEPENVDPALDDSLTAVFQYQIGSGISVGGTANNVVTVQHSTDNTAVARSLGYFLWNITDNIVLASGRLTIVRSAKTFP